MTRDTMMIRAGWLMSGLVVLFLLGGSAAPKLLGMAVAGDTLRQLGWDPRHMTTIGIVELTCTILYAVPRTRMLGAILLTGLFGGAIATHLRIGSPLFSHTLFGVYLGLLTWGGLWLRDPAIRAAFPLRRGQSAG